MPSIVEHVQKSELGAEVTLVELDLSTWGEGILRWIVGDEGDILHSVDFGGNTYTPFPVQLEGFEISTGGTLPRPTLTVSDVGGLLTPLVRDHGNLTGAPFRRIVTYERFLDDGEEPDSDSTHPQDEYLLARKTSHVPGLSIQWELQAHMDVAGAMLPARQIVRDFCDQEYRVWDAVAGDFDYTNATCPYTGDTYYNASDQPCAAEDDVCSKRLLGGCKARFGANAELPFRGFPAVNRSRIR